MDALTLFARTLMQRVEERQNTELSCTDLQPELMDRASYLPSGERAPLENSASSASFHPGANNHGLSAILASYPCATTHYGKCSYLGDRTELTSECAGQHELYSSSGALPTDTDTSPQQNRPYTPRARVMSGYITIEEHEQVLRQNAKLLQELRTAKEEAQCANNAIRDLAKWAYDERFRLMGTTREEDEAILSEAACRLLAQEVNKARAEVGLPPLSPEEMSLRLRVIHNGRRMHARGDVTAHAQIYSDYLPEPDIVGAKEASAVDVGATPSIMEQVEELIAQEKGRLSTSGV